MPGSTPPRSSSILLAAQPRQIELNIPNIAKNPKGYDTNVRILAARHIIGTTGYTAAEHTFTATQIMKDLASYSVYEKA